MEGLAKKRTQGTKNVLEKKATKEVLENKVVKEDLANKGNKEVMVAYETKWCSLKHLVWARMAATFNTTATTKPDDEVLTKRLKASIARLGSTSSVDLLCSLTLLREASSFRFIFRFSGAGITFSEDECMLRVDPCNDPRL